MSDKAPHQKMNRRLGPGVWVDENENLHFSLPELLAHFNVADTPENREQLAMVCEDVVRESNPTCKIIHRENDI